MPMNQLQSSNSLQSPPKSQPHLQDLSWSNRRREFAVLLKRFSSLGSGRVDTVEESVCLSPLAQSCSQNLGGLGLSQ